MIMNELFETAKKKFSLKEDEVFEEPTDKKTQMLKCQALMEEMEAKGALAEEKSNLLLYMATLTNAEKDILDWRRAYEELKIDDMLKFYIYTDEEEKESHDEL